MPSLLFDRAVYVIKGITNLLYQPAELSAASRFAIKSH